MLLAGIELLNGQNLIEVIGGRAYAGVCNAADHLAVQNIGPCAVHKQIAEIVVGGRIADGAAIIIGDFDIGRVGLNINLIADALGT